MFEAYTRGRDRGSAMWGGKDLSVVLGINVNNVLFVI